jgi:hypothetical protein
VVPQEAYESAIEGAEVAFSELVEAAEQFVQDCDSELVAAHG